MFSPDSGNTNRFFCLFSVTGDSSTFSSECYSNGSYINCNTANGIFSASSKSLFDARNDAFHIGSLASDDSLELFP